MSTTPTRPIWSKPILGLWRTSRRSSPRQVESQQNGSEFYGMESQLQEKRSIKPSEIMESLGKTDSALGHHAVSNESYYDQMGGDLDSLNN